MSPDKLPKFTKVDIATKIDSQYHWRTQYRHSDGLLFQAVEGKLPDRNELLKNAQLREIIGPVAVVAETDNGLVIHSDLGAVPPPDRATKTDTVSFLSDTGTRTLPVLQRFSQCMDPTRDLMGCDQCSNRGLPCLSGETHGALEVELQTASPKKIDDNLKDNKTIVAGFRYVSPVLLADEDETFVKGARNPDSISWGAEEGRRAMRRAASTQASITRHFKATECAVCIAREGGCDHWRNCPGAYPTADVHAALALEDGLELMKATAAEGTLQLWQMYAVMRLAGELGDRAWDRRQVLLGGLYPNGRGLAIRVAAYKQKTDYDYRVTTDWARLRKVFTSLPATADDPRAAKPSNADIALYFATLQARHFRPVLRGFQGYQSDPIGYLAIQPAGGVWVQRARPWGIRTGFGNYNGVSVHNWADYYRTFARLPGKRRRTRPEVYTYD